MRIYQILFSPTGGTKKATAPFAEVFGREVSTIDLTDASMDFSQWPSPPLVAGSRPSRWNGWSESAPTAQWPFWWWSMETGPTMTRCWN